MRWTGPTAQSVHGCYEACTSRRNCQYFAFVQDVSCRIYSSECSDIEAKVETGPWLYAREADMLPAAHALSKLAEACGVVGMLPPDAAKVLTRLSIKSPWDRPIAPGPRYEPAISVTSPNLTHFSFSFTSRPFQTQADGHGRQPTGGGSGGMPTGDGGVLGYSVPATGRGTLRVDLERRWLYLRSEIHNLSSGIPLAVSEVMYRGGHAEAESEVYIYTRAEGGSVEYKTCWAFRGPRIEGRSTQPNPFSFGMPASPESSAKSRWYSFYIPGVHSKSINFFVDESGSKLETLRVDDIARRASTVATISEWSSARPEETWFQPREEWQCPGLSFDPDVEKQLAQWQLIDIFFPSSDVRRSGTWPPPGFEQRAGRRLSDV